MKKWMIIAAALTLAPVSVPVWAADDVVESKQSYNISIEPRFSKGVEAKGLDIYRIVYKDEFTGERAHMDIDVSIGTNQGTIPAGKYKIQGIAYIGTTKALKKQPVATSAIIRTYDDKPASVVFAIGEEAMDDLKKEIGVGNIYTEFLVTAGTSTDMTESNMEANFNSPFVDESVFGSDDEARQQYIDSMIEQGYFNEDGTMSDKGKELYEQLEESEQSYEDARKNAIVEGKTMDEYLGNEPNTPETTEAPDDEGFSDGKVKETRYDTEPETVQEEKSSVWWSVLPYGLLALMGIVTGWIIWKKTK